MGNERHLEKVSYDIRDRVISCRYFICIDTRTLQILL